jgi:hypothetical protein
MIRKLILIISSIFIVQLFMESSCSSKGDYIKIVGFNVELYDRTDGRANPLQNGDTTYADTLRIPTEISIDYIAQNLSSTNSAYAYDPPKSGIEGLKSKIRSIVFSSDGPFQGLPANTSLNEFITCNYMHTRDDISIDSLKNVFNSNYVYTQCTFYINAKSNYYSLQKFTMVFEFENGENIQFETPIIVWL